MGNTALAKTTCPPDSKNYSQLSQDQLSSFCTAYAAWALVKSKLDPITPYNFCICGILGLVGAVFMIIVFAQKEFNGPHFLYHRAVAVCELIIMLITVPYSIFRFLNFPPSYGMAVYSLKLLNGWVIGDGMKFTIANISVMVSIERLIAIYGATQFKRLNNYAVSGCAVVISLLAGCLHWTPLTSAITLNNNGTYVVGMDASNQARVAAGYIELALPAIKAGYCVVLFAVSAAICLGLYRKSKLVEAMASNTTAKESWDKTKRLCIFQLILATTSFFDHASWLVFRFGLFLEVQYNAPTSFTYEQAMAHLSMKKFADISGPIYSFFFSVLHCGRCYIYVIFYKTFRDAAATLLGTSKYKFDFLYCIFCQLG